MRPIQDSLARRLSLICCVALLASGCVERSLTIRTDPPGAKVYLNEKLEGESPVTFDFKWYGWQRVTIRMDGYERLDDKRLLKAPVHLWIPLDMFVELMPFTVRDDRTWDYALTAIPEDPALPEGVEPGFAPKSEPGEWEEP